MALQTLFAAGERAARFSRARPRAAWPALALLALLAGPAVAQSTRTAPAPGDAVPAPGSGTAPDADADNLLDLSAPLRWQGRFPEQRRDTDGDGIADLDDNCPVTPAGTPVDECGCPADFCRIDTDGDSVADCHDQCPGTAKGVRVNRTTGCPLPIARNTRVRLDVKFAFAEAIIVDAFVPDLDRLHDLLVRFPELVVRLEGHTDNVGGDAYNQALSRVRAGVVRRYLLADGRVAPERVTAVGFGESRPVALNTTDLGRARNRRTVAELSVDYRLLPDNSGALPPALPEELPLGALPANLQPAPPVPVPPAPPSAATLPPAAPVSRPNPTSPNPASPR